MGRTRGLYMLRGLMPLVILVSLLFTSQLPLRGAAGASPEGMPSAGLATSAGGWQPETPPADLVGTADCAALVSIWGTSPANVYAIASCGAMIHYDGNEWSMFSPGPLVSYAGDELPPSAADIWGTSSSDIFVLCNNGFNEEEGPYDHVLHYDGSSWTMSATQGGDTGSLSGIWGTSSSDVFVVGSADIGVVLHYDGTSWSNHMGDDVFFEDVWGSSSSNVFAVGGGLWGSEVGAIFRYDGSTWTSMVSGTTSALGGVWGSSSSNVFAVGGGGTILHYDGSAWTPMVSGTASDLSAVWGSGASDVYAVGSGGTVLHYDGSAWSLDISGTTENLLDVWGTSSCDVFAVGSNGTILHYTCPSAPAVETDAADNVTASSAELRGRLTDLDSASSVQVSFEWGPTDAYGNSTVAQTMNAPGSFSAPLSGLAPATTYHFRVVAMGDDTAYGGDKAFTTSAAPLASPKVTTNAASGADTTAATLNGNLGNLGTASAVQVSFEWGTTPEYGNATTPQTMNGPGSFSAALSGLAPATTYHFRAKAVGDGTSYGAEESFTTIAKAPLIGSLAASSARQGEDLTVTISGSNLSGATDVAFGAGIAIIEFRSVSDSEIAAEIAVESNAAIGKRDITVTTPGGTATAPGGFVVNDGGTHVRLWVYLVAVVGGLLGLGILASLGVWLRRRLAR